MLKIRKAHSLKVLSIVVSISLLFGSTLFAYPQPKDTLRVPVRVEGGRARWALYRTFYQDKVDRPLEPDEAIEYLKDKRPDTILVLRQDTMKTEAMPKKSVDIGQIKRRELEVLRLKEGERLKGRRYVLIITERAGGKLEKAENVENRAQEAYREGRLDDALEMYKLAVRRFKAAGRLDLAGVAERKVWEIERKMLISKPPVAERAEVPHWPGPGSGAGLGSSGLGGGWVPIMGDGQAGEVGGLTAADLGLQEERLLSAIAEIIPIYLYGEEAESVALEDRLDELFTTYYSLMVRQRKQDAGHGPGDIKAVVKNALYLVHLLGMGEEGKGLTSEGLKDVEFVVRCADFLDRLTYKRIWDRYPQPLWRDRGKVGYREYWLRERDSIAFYDSFDGKRLQELLRKKDPGKLREKERNISILRSYVEALMEERKYVETVNWSTGKTFLEAEFERSERAFAENTDPEQLLKETRASLIADSGNVFRQMYGRFGISLEKVLGWLYGTNVIKLNDLKKGDTVVLFLEEQVRNDVDSFRKAVIDLRKNNNTVVILTSSKKSFYKFCIDKDLLDLITKLEVGVMTPQELGLLGFDFDQVRTAVMGTGMFIFECIPLTDSLCETYKALEKARDQV